jgi:hypothetical protein
MSATLERKRPRWQRTAQLVGVLLVASCGVTVGPQNPHPDIPAAPQQRSVRLVLGPGIADHLSLPDNNLEVREWRRTLNAAFQNGFAKAYRLASAADADLTLTLDEVHVKLGYFETGNVQIEYRATVTGKDVLPREEGGVAAKTHGGITGSWGGMIGGDLSSAVEAMYEGIAKDLPTMIPRPSAPVAASTSAASSSPAPPASRPPAASTPPPGSVDAPPKCIPGQSVACAGPKACQGSQVCTDQGKYGACSCE